MFGPTFLQEVQNFFQTGQMKPKTALTNLVLILKIDEPKKLEHYRPVSVCNVVYKTISKLIALRLKPYIHSCIAESQSAFLLGRDISENVILLREVLHSFKMTSHKNEELCLKMDLSKAFDRMDWDYLE